MNFFHKFYKYIIINKIIVELIMNLEKYLTEVPTKMKYDKLSRETKFEQYLMEISFPPTSPFSSNQKTIVSVDFTSDCPKRRAGNPCPYCYVEYKREIGFNAKKVYDYKGYNNELKNIKKFNPNVVKDINNSGGLRLFSFGDYIPEHDKDIKAMLDDAARIGLDIKVITKVPEFVYKYHNHPAVRVINISTDFVGHGVDHELAKELKSKYNKVVIRTVVLKDVDLEDDFMKYVDIITFNHENLHVKGFKKYSKKQIQDYYKKTKNLGICCITGKCATCPIKCGKRKYSQTCLMMEV